MRTTLTWIMASKTLTPLDRFKAWATNPNIAAGRAIGVKPVGAANLQLRFAEPSAPFDASLTRQSDGTLRLRSTLYSSVDGMTISSDIASSAPSMTRPWIPIGNTAEGVCVEARRRVLCIALSKLGV